MNLQAINLKEKYAKFSEHWQPKNIAQINDYHIKIAKVQGEFSWHDHPETDEFFLVVKGRLDIHLRDGVVTLHDGEIYVVPKGVEHKPVAQEECHILLIEPVGTINTGKVVDEKTAPNNVWI